MRFQNCPKNEQILEYVSIAKELSTFRLAKMKLHLKVCSECHGKYQVISDQWAKFFQPEPDMTSSLLRVYSRLQKDETLVLKGWKLNDSRLLNGRWQWPLRDSRVRSAMRNVSWAGGMVSAVAAAWAMVVWLPSYKGDIQSTEARMGLSNAAAQFTIPKPIHVPFAQIRVQDKNRVQVHYVQPELLQTIEFETTDQIPNQR